jgi:hypothetical protein
LAWFVCAYFLVTFLFHYRSDRFATDEQLGRHVAEASDEFFQKLKESMGSLETGGKTHEAVRHAFRNSHTRYIRIRYEFDFWSAVGISVAALLAGAVWLVMKAIAHC